MMVARSVTGANNIQAGYYGGGINMDSASRSIKKQIENAQKQLQELSSNEDMPLEEKMKKRQEIQQEITSLNQQLVQHQIEQRKQQQPKDNIIDNMPDRRQKTDKNKTRSRGNGISQAGMQALAMADSSIKQAKVQGSVATKMEGMANVLKSEIKQDAGRGGSTEAKQAALEEIIDKAVKAASSQLDTLASANQEIKEATEAGQESQTDKDGQKTGAAREDSTKNAENKDKTENENQETVQTAEAPDATGTSPQPVAYKPINIAI